MCKPSDLLVLVVDSLDLLEDVCSQLQRDTGIAQILCSENLREADSMLENHSDIDMVFIRDKVDWVHELPILHRKPLFVYYSDHVDALNAAQAYATGNVSQYFEVADGFGFVGDVVHLAVEKCNLQEVRCAI